MEISSYRRVFDLERRLYRIDRLRLNPGGVPVRGVVYFLAMLAIGLVTQELPWLGAVTRLIPWYLRDLALPAAGATVFGVIRIEGRPFHLAAQALMRYRLGPRRLAGLRRCGTLGERWWPQDILLLPDGSDGRMRRLRYTGPGAVLVTVEHERAGHTRGRLARRLGPLGSRPDVTLQQLPDARALIRGQVIALGPGARLLVRRPEGRADQRAPARPGR
jgi:hypothetical protein